MDLPFRIEKKESFRTVGYKIQTTNRRGEGRKAIPALWTRFKTENLDKPLQALSNQKQQGLLGINIYNTDETDPRKFEYLIAVSSDKDTRNDITEYAIPAMTWAIFPCTCLLYTSLLDNAIEASPKGSTVYIAVRKKGTYLELLVSNPAPAMSNTEFMGLFRNCLLYTSRCV